jgi:hypothetical protein
VRLLSGLRISVTRKHARVAAGKVRVQARHPIREIANNQGFLLLRSRDHAEAAKESARTQPYWVLLGALRPDCL